MVLGGGQVMVLARCHRAPSGPPGGVSTGPSGGEVEMALAQGHQAASAWGHVTLARSPGADDRPAEAKGGVGRLPPRQGHALKWWEWSAMPGRTEVEGGGERRVASLLVVKWRRSPRPPR